MAVGDPEAFTVYGWIVCVWVLIVSFQASPPHTRPNSLLNVSHLLQYGFHISSLNQISGVLTCRKTEPDLPSTYYGLPTCIAMDDATFSVLTSVYTVGGLLGSLGANVVMDRWGRKGACLASAFVMAVGAGFMAVSATLPPLIIGR